MALWPRRPNTAFSGYQLLLEYFSFRREVYVCRAATEPGDHRGSLAGQDLSGFEIDVVLSGKPGHQRSACSAQRKTIRLHCAPVINLFTAGSRPADVFTPLENEYLLQAACVFRTGTRKLTASITSMAAATDRQSGLCAVFELSAPGRDVAPRCAGALFPYAGETRPLRSA
ncbi:type VI secretion system baseplate subunit TssF [Klebsiella pneumoniae]|uniref:type VI secretion system baseplate subunit TssF n=1 Tax=Klebsiella pneumoniae TaxID=573 RepID=UPI0039DF58C8